MCNLKEGLAQKSVETYINLYTDIPSPNQTTYKVNKNESNIRLAIYSS